MSKNIGVEYPHVMVIDIRKFMVIDILKFPRYGMDVVRNGSSDGLIIKLIVAITLSPQNM